MININITNVLEYRGDTTFFKEVIAPELTVVNPLFKEAEKAGRSTYNMLPVIKNFTVNPKGTILIPKGYRDRLQELISINKLNINIEDKRVLIQYDKKLEHNIKLRDYQYEALDTLGRYSEGLLVAPAGSGKTVMGIGLIIMSRQKILWLTHTHHLANQFVERFSSFITNLEEKDIGIIGGGKKTIGKVATVGLIQTFVRRPGLIQELKKEFGMIIIDECHHTPASTFTKVATSFEAYFSFGLTATPYRRDGLEKIMYQNIGPIRHKVNRQKVNKRNEVITPFVIPVYLSTENINESNYQALISSLMVNDTRNNKIVQDIIMEYNLNNIIIVATDRRKHADILYNKLQAQNVKVGIATGSYKKEECEKALENLREGLINVLVCTSQLLGEGFDYPPLNRLFLALPFRNIVKCEQLTGRIQRPAPGKKDALIYDYVDISSGLLKHQFRNNGLKGCRYNVYKKLGCQIKQ